MLPFVEINRVDTRSRRDRNQLSLVKAAQSEGQAGIIHFLEFESNVKLIVAENFEKEKDALIDILLKTKRLNRSKKKQGRRYEENLKKFALYLYLNGGKFTYENLAKNFDASFPSLSTVKKLLCSLVPMLESELRVEHLYKFLDRSNFKLVVWISEDQTKIVEQVVYDIRSNRLLGFVSNLDNNGFPKENTFEARSAYIIKKHFDNGVRAPYVNIVMAQPLNLNAPAFCIAAYGSNSKFTSRDVGNRWKFIDSECSKKHITALGFSTDGASPCVKHMREELELGYAIDENRPWIKVGIFKVYESYLPSI